MLGCYGGEGKLWQNLIEAADSEGISAQEKCTRLHVLNVKQNVKCRSNQLKANQSFAKIAT